MLIRPTAGEAADVATLLGPDERWFWEKLLGRVAKGGGKLVGLQRVGGSRYWAVLAKGQDGSNKVLFLDDTDPASDKLLADLQARLRGETYYGRYWEVEPDRDFARRVAENLGPAGVSIVLLSSALVGDDETFLVGVENGKTEVLWAGGGLVGGIAGKRLAGIGVDRIDELIHKGANQRRVWKLTDPKSFKYAQNPKHGSLARGRANPEPRNPLNVLRNNSVWLDAENTTRRVGVDRVNGEFVVFDQTGIDANGYRVFHGHSRTWKELTQAMKQRLIDAGLVGRGGKL